MNLFAEDINLMSESQISIIGDLKSVYDAGLKIE